MENNDTSATMSQQHVPPRQAERRGGMSVPYTKMYPIIRGGQCDACGTLDKDVPSTEQYKLCPHFRSMGEIECGYCDPSKDPREVRRISVLKVHDHPWDKDPYGRPTLVVVCDSFDCSQKHEQRFNISSR